MKENRGPEGGGGTHTTMHGNAMHDEYFISAQTCSKCKGWDGTVICSSWDLSDKGSSKWTTGGGGEMK